MKKIFAIFAAVICLASCRMTGPSLGAARTKDDLIEFSRIVSDGVSQPYSLFKQLYCVHLYMNYSGPDREIQWFARYGKCYINGNEIKTDINNYLIRTNGLKFMEDGAVHSVAGYTFVCSNDGETVKWAVTNSKADGRYATLLEYTLLDLDYEFMHVDIKGTVTRFDSTSNGFSTTDYSIYELDFVKPWDFARTNDTMESNQCLYVTTFNLTTEYPVGEYKFCLYYKGVMTDWVVATMAGDRNYDYKTSRD